MKLTDLPYDIFTIIFSYENIPVQLAIKLYEKNKFFNQLFKYDSLNGHVLKFKYDLRCNMNHNWNNANDNTVKPLQYITN